MAVDGKGPVEELDLASLPVLLLPGRRRSLPQAVGSGRRRGRSRGGEQGKGGEQRAGPDALRLGAAPVPLRLERGEEVELFRANKPTLPEESTPHLPQEGLASWESLASSGDIERARARANEIKKPSFSLSFLITGRQRERGKGKLERKGEKGKGTEVTCMSSIYYKFTVLNCRGPSAGPRRGRRWRERRACVCAHTAAHAPHCSWAENGAHFAPIGTDLCM